MWTDGPAADADGARDVLLVDRTTEYLAHLSRHGLGRPARSEHVACSMSTDYHHRSMRETDVGPYKTQRHHSAIVYR